MNKYHTIESIDFKRNISILKVDWKTHHFYKNFTLVLTAFIQVIY